MSQFDIRNANCHRELTVDFTVIGRARGTFAGEKGTEPTF